MMLLTKALRKQLPPLGATAEEADPMIIVKLFYPDFHWSWYGIEFCPETEIFFGFVDGEFPELGSFSLVELKNTRGKLGCSIERDRHFQPCRLSALRKQLGR